MLSPQNFLGFLLTKQRVSHILSVNHRNIKQLSALRQTIILPAKLTLLRVCWCVGKQFLRAEVVEHEPQVATAGVLLGELRFATLYKPPLEVMYEGWTTEQVVFVFLSVGEEAEYGLPSAFFGFAVRTEVVFPE